MIIEDVAPLAVGLSRVAARSVVSSSDNLNSKATATATTPT
jgi:hypothetical protein